MDCVLLARHLTKRFGELVAVKDLSLELHKGRCLTLLGPNGAGKTTMVEMLEGLQQPDSGEISIFSKTFNEDSKRVILEKVGVLLQETSLYKKLKVRETLELFASFYQNPAPTETILKKLSLQEKAEARLEQLSGGLKQRVYLGCALINNPQILFLDEPTTGLDPKARRDIWTIIEGLKKDGTAILLTTHYMEEAEHLADHVMVIDKGQNLFYGETKELLRSYARTSHVEVAFKASDSTKSKIAQLGLGNIVDLGLGEYAVHARQASASDVLRKFSDYDAEIMELKVLSPSLEDIYLQLTKNGGHVHE